MKQTLTSLKLMLSYFTLFPVHFHQDEHFSSEVFAGMLRLFPLAGLLIQLLSLLLFLLLEPLTPLAPLMGAFSMMMLYGFLHTEAILDVADAWYARYGNKDIYAIIKEPTVGAMGVLWGVSFLILKIATLAYLLSIDSFGLLLVVPIISRLGLLQLFATQPFRSTNLNQLREAFGFRDFLLSLVAFSLLGILIAGWHYLLLLLLGLALALYLAKKLKRHLGFINGDVLGTTLELNELLLFWIGLLLWQ